MHNLLATRICGIFSKKVVICFSICCSTTLTFIKRNHYLEKLRRFSNAVSEIVTVLPYLGLTIISRRKDHTVRRGNNAQNIISRFSNLGHNCKSTQLYELICHSKCKKARSTQKSFYLSDCFSLFIVRPIDKSHTIIFSKVKFGLVFVPHTFFP